MSKTVIIPDNVTRMEIVINGQHYVFEGGATVVVPDEVAALLSANEQNAPHGERATSESKNAGLLPPDSYDPIPIYTDASGNLLAPNKNAVKLVRFTEVDEVIKADITFIETYTAAVRGLAVIALMDGQQLPCISAGATEISFQGVTVDTEQATMTVATIVWNKTERTITKTETVYELTEHQESQEEAGE